MGSIGALMKHPSHSTVYKLADARILNCRVWNIDSNFQCLYSGLPPFDIKPKSHVRCRHMSRDDNIIYVQPPTVV